MLTLPAPYPEALKSAFGWGVSVSVVGDPSLVVPVLDGEATLSLDAAVSRAMTLNVAGEDFGVATATDLFQAIWDLGGVLAASAILRVPGVADAVVPLGQFQVQNAKWSRTARAGFTVDALGRGSLLADHRFDAPRTFAAGSGLARLQLLLQETLPQSSVALGPGLADKTVPETTVDEDRLQHCHDVAALIGGSFFEKANGDFEVRLSTGATVDVDGTLMSQEVGYSRDRLYNGVRARSTNEAAPPDATALVTDDDPASPTRWGGPFGKKPRFYASPVITTAQQAQDTARTLLERSLGRHYGLTVSMVQNPAVEPGDLIVQTIAGTATTFRVTEVKVPFQVGGTMGLTVVEHG